MTTVAVPERVLTHVTTTQWRSGSPPIVLDNDDVDAPRKVLGDHDGVLWLEYTAPRNEALLTEAQNAETDSNAVDPSALVRCLDALDLLAGAPPRDRERVATRLEALKDPCAWLHPGGFWKPGIHSQPGVVTAFAAAPASEELLDVMHSNCGVLLGSMSFVSFPRCLVTIMWPTRVPLDSKPDGHQVDGVREALRANEMVYFRTRERFRGAVARRWQGSPGDWQGGDLAVHAITALSESLARTTRQITHRSLKVETRSLGSALRSTGDDDTMRALYTRLGDLTLHLGEFMTDVAALRSNAGAKMHFVSDEQALAELIAIYDGALEELRGLWRDLRMSMDAINGAGTVLLLDAARKQEQLALERQQVEELRQQVEKQRETVETDRRNAAERFNNRVATASAVFLPPALLATIYGAEVYVPVGGPESRAVMLAVLMVASIVGSLLWLSRLRRKDEDEARAQAAAST